jgi:hypothetical protein
MKPQSQCCNGHPYVPGSYRIRSSRDRPSKVCLECARERNRKYYQKVQSTDNKLSDIRLDQIALERLQMEGWR